MHIKRKEEFIKRKWSGGTTTELFIYPHDAEYSNRNFKWRISSAEVEEEKSEFTYLPGVDRIIMSLNEPFKLKHNGRKEISLKPYEAYSFKGEWDTRSRGKIIDFNLMLKGGSEGEVRKISIKRGDEQSFSWNYEKGEKRFRGFYIVQGEVEVVSKESTKLRKGDFCRICEDIILKNNEELTAIIIETKIKW